MSLLLGFATPTRGQHLSFRYYSQPDGLTELGVDCLHQDPAGYIVACTEHGVYAYDGRRFVNLGIAQGLPEGGVVYDIAFGRGGEMFIRYVDRVFVSRQPVGASQPPQSLSFRAALSDVGSFYEQHVGHMASSGRGVVLIANGQFAFLDPGDPDGTPHIRQLAARPEVFGNAPPAPVSIVSAGGILWTHLSDGRLCAFGEVSGHCYSPADGLPASGWDSVVSGAGSKFFARSANLFATIDPSTHRASTELLPFQRDRYVTYSHDLQLARSPAGGLVTQSFDGMIVRDGTTWKHLNALSGIPQVSLTSFLFDRQGNLWFAGLGRGVFRAVGYGRWENRDRSDGLSDNLVWQMTRQPGGPLWVTTESGLDAIGDAGPAPVARRSLDISGFSIANGARGNVWQSEAALGALCLNVATGSVEHFRMPPVNRIVRGPGDRVWFATEKGMFYVDDSSTAPRRVVAVPAVTSRVQAAAIDADGSVWMVQDARLTHLHTDGTVSVVVKDWLGQQFEPLDMSFRSSDEIWVAGAGGGLFRVALLGDVVASLVQVSTPDILSNTVVSVLVDRRGWVWAGTGGGVSVFNGQRWTSLDTSSGLIWNDLSQGGLYEDIDGSIWVATSQGLSHLLDPAAVFKPAPLDATISGVRLGDRLFPQRAIKYTTDPLLLEFGTSDYRSELSLTFRYMLEGVDKTWAEAPDGRARYPFVPPGRHILSVVAVNPLTHQSSRPASFVFRIGKPWWLMWPVEAAEGILALLAVYGVWRLRYRSILRQQRILHRTVEQRTEEIRVAQAALMLQAAQDSLTGLLTRGETQKRLAAMLARHDRRSRLIIGLIDIDHFKRINDTHGHLGGDEILKEMGVRTLAILRPGEYAGRYGGEEVLVVLNDDDGSGTARIAAFHETIRRVPFPIDLKLVSVSCSVGISWARAHDDWKTLIGRADEALYIAKREGRDRIIESDARYTASSNV